MTWQVLLTREAEKNLKKLPSSLFERVRDAIREITAHPFSGKPLRGNLKGQYAFRIGDYRLVYILEEKHRRLYVLYVRHRRDAY